MKKLFSILVLGMALTACNSGDQESKAAVTDSSLSESPLMDAVQIKDSVEKVMEAGSDTATSRLMEEGKEGKKP